MSSQIGKYRVLKDGHIHNGVALKKGAIVEIRPKLAARYSQVFAAVGESAPSSQAAAPQARDKS